MTAERPLARLSALVQIPTVSRLDASRTDWAQFERFIEALPELYPRAHAALEREVVADYSLLYRWPGATNGAPAVLMAHYDVVPATDEGWEHPPFAGTVTGEITGDSDGRTVWGRGTLDDKGALVSILEAVEALAAAGHVPERDLYLSFGHDEETAGSGAAATVALLESRGVRPALVLDEGGAVVEGIFPGVTGQIAVVGVSEKGSMGLALTVEQAGGHASTPPRLSATARLARAIVRLNARPFPAAFSPVNLEMIRRLGAHATGPLRFASGRLRLTKPLLLLAFRALSDETRAVVRTTQVVTMLSGSQAANALAESAEAIVNVRIAVGSSVAETVEHVRRAIRDPLVAIDARNANEPSPVSPTTGEAWELVSETIEAVYPGVIVAPYVMLAASDSRHYARISEHVYRFSPFDMSAGERATLHARNERIRVATFVRGIAFYDRLISRL